jgi:hypothetical protein
LPLLDDWFIRPLFYIDKLNEEARDNLVCAIFKFASICCESEIVSKQLLRVTPSELVMLVAELVSESESRAHLGPNSLQAIEAFVDQFFEGSESVRIKAFRTSENSYLTNAYKKTFMQSNFVQRLTSWFN